MSSGSRGRIPAITHREGEGSTDGGALGGGTSSVSLETILSSVYLCVLGHTLNTQTLQVSVSPFANRIFDFVDLKQPK